MNLVNFIRLFILLLTFLISCNSPESTPSNSPKGEVDKLVQPEQPAKPPQSSHAAIRQNANDIILLNPKWSVELSEQVSETSGLIIWEDALWTMNDDTDRKLYALDMTSGEIIAAYGLPGVENRDWEEISQDKDYVYVGDFGNNLGNRVDLHILRIEKQSLKSENPTIDRISFSFSDQQNFDPAGINQTEFDCEAFVVTSDSIYLFTKQWTSGFTTQYSLPKQPGNYVAKKKEVFNAGGQVTSACYLEKESILILCGYSGFVQPFLYMFYDYQDYDFFEGLNKRILINLPVHQVEGLACTAEGLCFISNETYSGNQFLRIPQKLHLIELGNILEDL